MSENIRIQIEENEDRLLARLNRPETRNAIDLALVAELHALCDDLERNPRVLVITGSKEVFAAGADIYELRTRGPVEALQGINSRVFDRISRLPMPTIAIVNGIAFGGGAELAYACDIRIATNDAKFGNPEINLGIMAAAGAVWRLRELVGLTMATEMLLTGRILSASEAFTYGLVSHLVADDELMTLVDTVVKRINSADPLAVRITKVALRAPVDAHPIIDDMSQAVLFQSPEKDRRMTEFLEKRGKK